MKAHSVSSKYNIEDIITLKIIKLHMLAIVGENPVKEFIRYLHISAIGSVTRHIHVHIAAKCYKFSSDFQI